MTVYIEEYIGEHPPDSVLVDDHSSIDDIKASFIENYLWLGICEEELRVVGDDWILTFYEIEEAEAVIWTRLGDILEVTWRLP